MKKITRLILLSTVILLSSMLLFAQEVQIYDTGPAGILNYSPRASVLYSQTNLAANGRPSQDFEVAYNAYDCFAADDFVVPSGDSWNIQTITAVGSGTPGPFNTVNVTFYYDAGGIPAAAPFASFMGIPASSNAGVITVTLTGGGVNLPSGHYWFSLQDAAPYGTNGQWFWTQNSVIYNSISCWKNPNNGFGTGATSWTPINAIWGDNTDFAFTLEGVVLVPCNYQIALYDSWGDGWNGGSVSVYVDGSVVLSNLTLPSGSGPAYYSFPVLTGSGISTVYTPGSWSYENSYQIIDAGGNVVYAVGNVSIPPGVLYGSCPTLGTLDGYVTNSAGLAIAGAIVGIPDLGISATTGSNGYYFLDPVQSGDWDAQAFKPGYNVITHNVTIVAGGITSQDFVLTSPNLSVSPLRLDETMAPNEYLTDYIGMLNTGSGPVDWTAEVVYPVTKAPVSAPVETIDWSTARRFDGKFGAGSFIPANGPPMSDRGTMDCPDGSTFSNPPVGSNNGYTSDAGVGYKVFQSFTGTTSVSTITFWTIFTSAPPATKDYNVEVYEAGTTPGAMVSSGVYTLTPVNTGVQVIGYDTYVFTVEIPSVAITDGWVAIQALAGSPTNYWLNSIPGIGTVLQWSGSSYLTYPGETCAMCIAGGGAGSWLTLDEYEGSVNGNGASYNLAANFNAAGTEVGEYYTADIVLTTDPNVGVITIPCTMSIAGDPIEPISDLVAELTNDITGRVELSWTHNIQPNFQYFRVKRNGVVVGLPTTTTYVNMLPNYGSFCYTVQAVYSQGASAPAGPECVDWFNPTLMLMDVPLYDALWPDDFGGDSFTIHNTGTGTLSYEFPAYTTTTTHSRFSGTYQIEMMDSYGDGWNGGSVTVYVAGVAVLVNATLPSGTGPGYASFPVESGDEIYTTYVSGSWPSEISYNILDTEDNVVYSVGPPIGAIPPGVLFAYVPAPSFIVDVEPAAGFIPAGGSALIVVTYSSMGFPVGTYLEDLELTTNDPDAPTTMIGNTMVVYEPASVFGQVTDCNTNLPLAGVTVSADLTDFTTETDGDGMYELRVDADTYDLTYFKLGFGSEHEYSVVCAVGSPVEINKELCEAPYPVQWVYADPNEADTECLVTWSLPMGPYEIAYDDGTAEEFTIWASGGGAVAVKFTPVGYPATVIGGRLNVGDGSFPAGGNFLGSSMAVGVIDDDGANGLPGTVLDSAIVTVDNYGWVDFYGALNTTFADGNFYLVMWQLGMSSNSAPIGIDNEQPIVYRSYAKMPGGAPWALSPYQDFMMRAYVSGPTSSVTMTSQETMKHLSRIPESARSLYIASGEPNYTSGTEKSGQILPVANAQVTGDRDLTNYVVALVSGFDPCGDPSLGTLTPIANPTTTSYNHTGWGGLAPGFYAYAVKAVYTSGESEWVYSNVVAHLLDNKVTINITLCDGESPEGAEVSLMGSGYPYQSLFDVTGPDGTVVFDSVIDGRYTITVFKVGYNPITFTVTISGDVVYDLVLSEKEYMPRNLYVDAQTSIATWDEPIIFALDVETFEGTTFPPVGWQATTDGAGWQRGDDGGSSYFPIPTGDGFYAYVNDDLDSGNDGSVDYLITPSIDLRESADFALTFDHFFTMQFGEEAYVEYSLDGGTTWDILQSMSAVSAWTTETVDLSAFSGPGGYSAIWFAFHYNDMGQWAAGWAVDNVSITNGPAVVLGYYVYLDGAFVAQKGINDRSHRFRDLQYGQTYTAGVAALYSCGISDPIEYTWTSGYLYPPRNLGDEYIYGTNEIPMMWNPPMTEAGPVMSFNRSTYVPAETSVNALEGNASTATFNGSRDLWDILYGFEMDGPSGLTGLAGGESDGEFIYAPVWSANSIAKFNPDGTFVETFTIPGVSGLRDLAFDGTYMYGAAAATTVWKMDFTNHTLISTITAPVAVRAIAYDADANGFWANNWSTDLTLFDMSGAILDVIPGPPSIYGLAWDGATDGGPFLWMFEGTTSGGGCWVSQWDIATGGPTGVQHSVSDDFGSAGIAGGLYFNGDIVSGKWTLGGTMQGAGDVAFGYDQGENTVGPPTGGDIPGGLLAFKLYQDGVEIAEVPYEGQGVDEWVTYVINPIDPGDYCFDVSALYDLTVFGFPGEIGESAWEGSDCVHVVWGFPIPFFEGWDQGTFDFNTWTTSSSNWSINPVVGTPEPSAEFSWDPLLENDYSSTLTSNPLNADLMTEGDMWLDFDVKLDDRNSTGLEMLNAEVYNGSTWNVVATFANNGSFDWTSSHIDVSAYAMTNSFRVRFNAVGMNSFDVVSWFVDNVSVYRTCQSISDLTGEEYNLEDVLLTWNAPVEPVVAEWLYYDDATIEYVWGSTAAWSSDEAIRFEPSQLVDFAGAAVTKISVFIDSRLLGVGTVSAKIWQGANASTLIYEEDVTSQIVIGDDFNEVTLASPAMFDNTQELWIGVNTAGPADTYGVGITTDMGTWNPNADLMNNGSGWEHIQDYGISNRAWLLRGFVTTSYQSVVLGSYTDNTTLIGGGQLTATSADVTISNVSSDRAISGFNVYRRTDDVSDYELLEFVAAETGVEAYTFLDENTVIGGTYWYQVTCVWEGETDYCESAPGWNVPMTEDFVYILIIDVNNPEAGELSVYPNPAKDKVNVTSNVAMNHISVMNYVGQVVYTSTLAGEHAVELNTSSYEAGVYVVQINTENGLVTKRVVISQ